MPLTVPSIGSIDQDTVDEQTALQKQLATEYNPSADLKRGVVGDYVLHLGAVLAAAGQENYKRLTSSLSLKTIQEDPTLADTDLVDNVLSNWGVTRKVGAPATGQVAIALSAQITVVVPEGALFTISGRTFAAKTVIASRISPADVVVPTDRLLVQAGNLWVFTVDVVDQANGEVGNVKRGASVSVSQPPPKFATAYVESDFSGGVDDETNAQLVARLPSGLAAKLWGGRGNIDALVRSQFPGVQDVSVIGFGDAEMLRDQHLLWPGATGGKTDVWVRSAKSFATTTVTKTATLVSKIGAVGTWQFTLSRDDVPGFYEIEKILTASQASSAAGFLPTSDVRSADLTDDLKGLLPAVANSTEAAYSYFQSAAVQFDDTVTDAGALSPGATASYRVVTRGMPDVKGIQNLLRDRSVGSSLSDALVRAVVPCFVSVTLTLNVPKGTAAPDTASLSQAVADAVNDMGFVSRLAASTAVAPVVAAYPKGSVTNVALVGRLRRPAGTVLNLVGTDSITLPDEPSGMVTSRTAAFLCTASDVAITVVEAALPAV